MRSKVVHGTKSYSRDPKAAEQLLLTITKLSDYLRQSILKMLIRALNPDATSKLIDWEGLMFQTIAPQITNETIAVSPPEIQNKLQAN